jgi:membrane-associated protease RseP (regulator of RpoE activity)
MWWSPGGVLIAKLFLGVLLVQILHLSAIALVGVLSGATLKQASLGIGPVLFRSRLRGAEVIVRLLPMNGYVQFWRSDDEPPAPEGARLFDDLPAYKRAATQLAGALAVFVVGSAIAGSLLWREARGGVIDLFRGALAPTSTGADLFAEMMMAARERPYHVFVSLLFVKVAAWNLLPIPPLNGGAVLVDLTMPRGRTGARATVTVVGFVIMLAAFIAWAIALVTFLWR